MTQRMLIDASHPEETRVAILDGNRLEAFDFESATRKQLKGNIYLAKVTRVEPSLQACFVDYGGNRQGFLAFSEIHPDYYQIPIADREALMAQAEEEGDEEEEEELETAPPAEGESEQAAEPPSETMEGEVTAAPVESTDAAAQPSENGEENVNPDEAPPEALAPVTVSPNGIETVGGDDAEEARSMRRIRVGRRYKIQEVIKRRQIILIQVVKEERGAKGAALTTYISLAGRYCVLMPNSAKSGVSRKISNYQDRRRLKSLLSDLEVPDGMAVILRTAGADRPKTDIKRDCDYLMKIWDDIRENTLQSTAPALIYEEGNLVKRAVRDLYSREIEQIIVEGEEGYKTAKNLMRVLTPSHAKRVQQYKDESVNLFQRYQVEGQIDSIHDSRVELPSGGYIIINQTEALVAIDVNSGRSTRERNIEETAYRTNLEAAEEIARQMRLRDVAGLIVIDFIDMEHHSNKVSVERRFKEAARKDRARMQIGRISHFGLLEMTRQRLRPSVLETSTNKCPTCNGSGIVRSTESSALTILRAMEDDLGKRRSREIKVFMATSAALYLLNHKRASLAGLEAQHGTKIILQFDDNLIPPAFHIERIKADPYDRDDRPAVRPPDMGAEETDPTEDEEIAEEEETIEADASEIGEQTQDEGRESRRDDNRRRRRRRGGRNRYGDRDRNRNFNQNGNGGEQNNGDGNGHSDSFGNAAFDSNEGEENLADGNRIETEEPEIDGNRDPNYAQGSQNRGERGERGERTRGRRGGRNRYRRGGRNRHNDRRDGQNQNPGQFQADGAANADFGNDAPPADHNPSFDDRPRQNFQADSDNHISEPSYRPAPSRDFAPAPEAVSESQPSGNIDPNVEMITGTPNNPKRGWWKRLGN